MYRCIGVPKRHFLHFGSYDGCGEVWDRDYDRCPICRGYLIPESLVTDKHWWEGREVETGSKSD